MSNAVSSPAPERDHARDEVGPAVAERLGEVPAAAVADQRQRPPRVAGDRARREPRARRARGRSSRRSRRCPSGAAAWPIRSSQPAITDSDVSPARKPGISTPGRRRRAGTPRAAIDGIDHQPAELGLPAQLGAVAAPPAPRRVGRRGRGRGGIEGLGHRRGSYHLGRRRVACCRGQSHRGGVDEGFVADRAAGGGAARAAGGGVRGRTPRWGGLRKVDHIVVIYEENHSFDNLYGGWERRQRPRATPTRAHTRQVDQAGAPYKCLLQNDVNLDLAAAVGRRCTDTAGTAFSEPLPERAVHDRRLHRARRTRRARRRASSRPTACSRAPGEPGGCTRDLVHRFYQEQYQLDGGAQDRYVTGCDAVGLTMGHYDTTQAADLRVPARPRAPELRDRRPLLPGGVRRLVPQPPVAGRRGDADVPERADDGSADDLHSMVDANGMPNTLPALHADRRRCKDARADRRRAARRNRPASRAATTRSTRSSRRTSRTRRAPRSQRLPPQTRADDRRPAERARASTGRGTRAAGRTPTATSAARAGRTATTPGTCTDPDTATGAVYPNCPDKLFQFHHQPLNYFAAFAPGTAARARSTCATRQEFEALAAGSKRHCRLKPVSFIKPIGAENEHPGYASEHDGLRPPRRPAAGRSRARAARRTRWSIVTYDEFGGQWDHVSPPGQGTATPGPARRDGPEHADPGADARARAAGTASRSTTRRTTRRRSWPRSSTASGCGRCPTRDAACRTCRRCSTAEDQRERA